MPTAGSATPTPTTSATPRSTPSCSEGRSAVGDGAAMKCERQ
jgi:hypothetical protein